MRNLETGKEIHRTRRELIKYGKAVVQVVAFQIKRAVFISQRALRKELYWLSDRNMRKFVIWEEAFSYFLFLIFFFFQNFLRELKIGVQL